MRRKLIFSLALFVCIAGFYAHPLKAEESAESADKKSKKGKISLVEAEPEVVYSFRRYSKFYGDENTARGGLLDRSYLLGSLGGFRDTLVEHGFYFDAGVTQFLQSNVSGGIDDGSGRYNGTADYWLTFDSGKADLWSGERCSCMQKAPGGQTRVSAPTSVPFCRPTLMQRCPRPANPKRSCYLKPI